MFFPPEDVEAGFPGQELTAAARDGRFEIEAWRMRKDGTKFWALVTLTAIRGADGALRGFAKVTRDMTAQKEAAEAMRKLNEQLERYRIMIESIDEYAIYTLDAEGTITSWGTGAQKVSGFSAAEVLGRHCSIFDSPADQASGQATFEIAEAARTGRYTTDRWRVLPNGSKVWSSGAITAVRDEAGQLTGFIRVARDMTKQKLMEESLERLAAELEARVTERTQQLESTVLELRHKNEEVEAFVYIVSHDLRAPLVNLMGFSRELERSCVSLKNLLESCALPEVASAAVYELLDADMPSSVHFISQSSLKFESLIDSLLSLSRHGRQVYEPVEVDVDEVAANAVATLHQAITEAGAEVEVGHLPPVTADLTAIGQVFSNLIGNSLKYRNPERPLKIEVGGQAEDGVVSYWVRDNGLGIPEASKARLFQVFQRFHPQRAQGEGMGLAIVHRIVERHGGKIWAESREGEGTTFRFSLPCSLEPSGAGSNPNVIQGAIDHGSDSISIHHPHRG
jgi:PAS domain S-box-containing protein